MHDSVYWIIHFLIQMILVILRINGSVHMHVKHENIRLYISTSDAQNIILSEHPGPQPVSKYAYPSLKPHGKLVIDLIYRSGFFDDWVTQGQPNSYWMSWFFCQCYPNLVYTSCVLARYLSGSALDRLYQTLVYTSWIY